MLKPKTYQILKDCIERGLQYGINKVLNDADDVKDIDVINLLNTQHIQIMNEICEYFDFDEE